MGEFGAEGAKIFFSKAWDDGGVTYENDLSRKMGKQYILPK